MKALDKLKSLNPFKKTVKEETKETAKGPWVKVIEVHFDKQNQEEVTLN